MAGPGFIVPDTDSFDVPLTPSFFNLGNPTLADLTNDGPVPVAYLSSQPQPQQNENEILEGNGHYLDPMIQDDFLNININFFNGGGQGNFEAGSSEVRLESQPVNENMGSQNNFNEVMPLAYWPDLPIPFSCSCCQVLREIVHTNGVDFTKLEIHGRLGIICHAIHHQNITSNSSTGNEQYQMIDFCRRSIDDVKVFLVQYCLQQIEAGYFIVQDPMSAYYEALCTGLDWTEDLYDDICDLNPNSGGNSGDDMEQEAEAGDEIIPRASLAAQRERAGKMKLSDLSDYFHLPIEEAAKQVNLCPTVVKRICRKEKLKRWPYRKVKSIVKQISILRKALASDDAVSRARTQAGIDRLIQEMIKQCGGVVPTKLNIE